MSFTGSGLMIVMNSNQLGSVLPSGKIQLLAEPGGGNWAAAGVGTLSGTTVPTRASAAVRLQLFTLLMHPSLGQNVADLPISHLPNPGNGGDVNQSGLAPV